jgi:hypothetical protein
MHFIITIANVSNEIIKIFDLRGPLITVEPRPFQFLKQRLRVAIHRGTAACVVWTVPIVACSGGQTDE